jgi:putative transposase
VKGFKTKLDLNNRQRTPMAKHAGVARHAWNWGLATCKKISEAGGKLPSAIDLHKRLVAEVKSQNPWYYEVSKCSPQEALSELGKSKEQVSPSLRKRMSKRVFTWKEALKFPVIG